MRLCALCAKTRLEHVTEAMTWTPIDKTLTQKNSRNETRAEIVERFTSLADGHPGGRCPRCRRTTTCATYATRLDQRQSGRTLCLDDRGILGVHEVVRDTFYGWGVMSAVEATKNPVEVIAHEHED